MRRLSLVLVAALIAISAAGCGSSSSSSSATSGATTSPVHFAKTKFVLHAGLAFGAFHRYVYKPYKNGQLNGHHKLKLLKAGVAALFAYHEAKIALRDAQSDRLLSKVVAPITALQNRLKGLGTRLRGGQLDGAGIGAANSDVNSVSSASKAAGQPVTDQPTPSLGG